MAKLNLDESVFQIWRKNARDRPAAAAYSDRFGTLSWSQALDSCERSRESFRAEGVGPGSTVLFVPSFEAASYVALAALQSLGARCVLVPDGLPTEQLSSLPLEPGSYLLATRGLGAPAATALRAAGLHPLRTQNASPSPLTAPETESPDLTGESRLIVFTSGTTQGIAKPVVQTHAARLWGARAIAQRCRIREGDSIYLSGLSLMAGPFSYFGYHGAASEMGATVVLATKESHEAESLAATFARREVTHWVTTPAQLLADFRRTPAGTFFRGSLRAIVVSMGALHPFAKQLLEDRFEVPILSYYGQTEAGLISGHDFGDPEAARLRSVGRALPGATLRLRDGELFVASPGLALGYLREEGPEPKFSRDERGTNWFRTGDAGEIDGEGFLSLLGRKGETLAAGAAHLGALESLFCLHPGILDFALFPSGGGLVGVYHGPGELDLSELARFLAACRERFPGSEFRLVRVDSFPRGPGLKTDRAGLAAKIGLAPEGRER